MWEDWGLDVCPPLGFHIMVWSHILTCDWPHCVPIKKSSAPILTWAELRVTGESAKGKKSGEPAVTRCFTGKHRLLQPALLQMTHHLLTFLDQLSASKLVFVLVKLVKNNQNKNTRPTDCTKLSVCMDLAAHCLPWNSTTMHFEPCVFAFWSQKGKLP